LHIRRLTVAALLTVAATIATATPAFAHAKLIASTPTAGEALAAAPQQISLTFSEPVTPAANTVAIAGADGTAWTVGTPAVAGAVVTVPVQPAGPAGAYTLTWRVTSSDGDEITGTIAFTMAVAAAPPTTSTPPTTSEAPPTTSTTAPAVDPAAQSESDSGLPVWLWIVIAVAALLAAGLVALRVAGGNKSRT
jgi:copper resistance protein C